jgi:hypothetical protein
MEKKSRLYTGDNFFLSLTLSPFPSYSLKAICRIGDNGGGYGRYVRILLSVEYSSNVLRIL